MLALKAGWLFDGWSETLVENPIVLIDGERIHTVGSSDTVSVLQGTAVADFPNAVLMPGLIDLHVHLTIGGEADPRSVMRDPEAAQALRAAANARRMLERGITSVRSLGAAFDADIALRRAIAKGEAVGPRITASGRCITMTGGHGHQMGIEADGPWAVRQAVRSVIKAGADVVKLMATGGVLTEGVEPGSPELSFEELQAAVVEAENAGRRTAAHAQGTVGIRQAVTAGIHSIEHGCFLDDAVIDQMGENGTVLVPTLSAPLNILRHGTAAGIPQYVVDKTKYIWEAHQASFRRAYEAGLTIGMGTDAGTPFNVPGENASELQYMVEAGMKSVDALRAATATAAEILSPTPDRGLLAPGRLADILVIAANPLEDVSLWSQPEALLAVFLGGKRVK